MTADLGLLVVRVVVGLYLAAHGSQKLFGWFGGGGLKGTAGWLGSMGMQPAMLWAVMAGASEFGGGLLLVLGFLNPLGSIGIGAAMLMAIVKAHWSKGVWNTKGGFELPLTNLTSALAVALIGPGGLSLDAALGIHLPVWPLLVAGLVLITLSIAVADSGLLGQRKPARA